MSPYWELCSVVDSLGKLVSDCIRTDNDTDGNCWSSLGVYSSLIVYLLVIK